MSIIQVLMGTISGSSANPFPLPGYGIPNIESVPAAGVFGSYTIPVPNGYQVGEAVPGLGGNLTPSLNVGLWRKKYKGTFVGNPSFFETASLMDSREDTYVSFEGCDFDSYFTMEWLGYFKPPVDGNYNFALRSDDQSGLWISDVAVSGFTYGGGGNHTVDNISSTDVTNPIYSVQTVYMVSNRYYPIRIRMQEMGGNEKLRFYYGPADAVTPLTGNLSGCIFYNSNINQFGNQFSGF